MKTLKLPTHEVAIKKTGLPFYDAARLIGAAHRQASTASVEVRDEGTRWVLTAPRLEQERERQQLAWALGWLPANVRSAKTLMATVEKFLEAGEDDEPPALTGKGKKPVRRESSVYHYLETAFQRGIRGPDPLASYRNLASQAGSKFSQPLCDVVDAAFGVAFAAISRGRQEEGERRVLPILAPGTQRLVMQPFLDFRRTYRHEAGVFVASVWASLALLDELTSQDLPVVDFAFNWVIPRVQSASGYVGVDRICTLLKRHKERGREFRLGQQIRHYLADTRSGEPLELDLARAAAHFATTADVRYLETIVRLKARLVGSEDGWPRRRAVQLLSGQSVIEEVREMMQQNTGPAELPVQLTWTIANWFRDKDEHPKGTEWIGDFIKLENSSSADRFLYEVERIVRHASSKDPNAYTAFGAERERLMQAARPSSPADFRAYKALFLLDILSKLGTRGRNSATAVGEAAAAVNEKEE